MSAISFIFPWILSFAFAGTVEVPAAKGDRIIMKGFQAQVVVTSALGPTRISGVDSSAAEGSYMVTKKDNIIEIKLVEYLGKKAWMDLMPKASSHLKKIEISGEALPLDIHLQGGSVTVQKWSRDMKISMTQGRVNISNSTGALYVTLQKGDVSVADHSGAVTVDAYSGMTSLRNVQGDVTATQFSGQLQAERLRGVLNLATQQATAKINQASGTINFENGKGSFAVSSFQGRVEGQNQEGSVSVSVLDESEVDVRSKSGKVSVQLPAASGASVNLLTNEGEILVPGELRVVKTTTDKSVKGRLRGDAQKVRVFVRSSEGSISVK